MHIWQRMCVCVYVRACARCLCDYSSRYVNFVNIRKNKNGGEIIHVCVRVCMYVCAVFFFFVCFFVFFCFFGVRTRLCRYRQSILRHLPQQFESWRIFAKNIYWVYLSKGKFGSHGSSWWKHGFDGNFFFIFVVCFCFLFFLLFIFFFFLLLFLFFFIMFLLAENKEPKRTA